MTFFSFFDIIITLFLSNRLRITESEVKTMTKKKTALMTVMAMTAMCLLYFSCTGLASMLGISAAAATKVINIIDTASTVTMIISLISVIVGAGAVSTALVAVAKKMIKKYGKKYAAMW